VPNRFWGRALEDNAFGTHEFMDLAEQLGAEPYIAGNLGSGTVQEMADWAEYLTRDDGSPMAELRRRNGRDAPWPVRLFGVGNESWGCGGNMRPEYYADLFRQYATYLREYGRGLSLVAAGPSAGYGGYGDDLRWTEILMREAGWLMGGYSLHYYTVTHNWRRKGSATEFDESEWFLTLRKAGWIDSVITAHGRVMDRFDPQKRVAMIVDEWGTWHDVPPDTAGHTLYQQNTLRDALVAGITLNSFNNHADRVRVANLAQTVNVLQSMILTQGDRMVRTPTYHVFSLFRGHHDATLLPSRIETPDYVFDGDAMPALSASASLDSTGAIRVTVTNADPRQRYSLRVPVEPHHRYFLARIVTAETMQAHNTFDEPDRVRVQGYREFRRSGDHLLLVVPARSIVTLEIR
jgi:alpha-N-arabinofuranosidase